MTATEPRTPAQSAVLIANRGEIAVRVARTARDLGIRSIAVYSEADSDALHTQVADEAWALSGNASSDTYMNIPLLLDVAARAGADCVHPGYGFLSENSTFAQAVQDAGLTWIGPSPDSIDLLGDKVAARRIATSVGAPLAPGTPDPIESWEAAASFAEEHGLPIAIKAAFGGGGRGLKVVDRKEDIEEGFASAGREAKEAFGRSECYVEKFLTRPRHVEAQVLADQDGHVVVVGTRDCSTQRRFQKLVEESPAPFLTDDQHRRIIEGARDICREAGYVGAGTVEFLVSEDGTVSFLEVNTRVQVEHPVTEVTSGVDIIAEQFRIAAGESLSVTTDPEPQGHALEFRINAEDVANGFAPCPGTVTEFELPTGPGVRVDSGVVTGSTIPPYYDSMLAKLIVWGPDRAIALRRARQALREFKVSGVRTVLPFHRDIVSHPAFTGDSLSVYTDWVDREYQPGAGNGVDDIEAAYTERHTISVEIDGRMHRVGLPTGLFAGTVPGHGDQQKSSGQTNTDSSASRTVSSPYDATLIEWRVADGDTVTADQPIVTIEAMKMESTITAPAGGVIHLNAEEGNRVKANEVIATIP